jgi:hypothetical protein
LIIAAARRNIYSYAPLQLKHASSEMLGISVDAQEKGKRARSIDIKPMALLLSVSPTIVRTALGGKHQVAENLSPNRVSFVS